MGLRFGIEGFRDLRASWVLSASSERELLKGWGSGLEGNIDVGLPWFDTCKKCHETVRAVVVEDLLRA